MAFRFITRHLVFVGSLEKCLLDVERQLSSATKTIPHVIHHLALVAAILLLFVHTLLLSDLIRPFVEFLERLHHSLPLAP